MILIRSKEQYQNCSCQQQPKDEAFTVERLSNLASFQTGSLEPSSNLVGSSAGIGSNQITRTNGTSDVTGFRKEAAIISSGSEAGVTSGSHGRKGDKLSLLGGDFQGPLSVNSLDVSKRDFDSKKDVVEDNTSFSDFNTWSPQQKVATQPQPTGQDSAFGQAAHSELDEAEGKGQQQNRTEDDGQIFAKAGSKSHTAKTLGGK